MARTTVTPSSVKLYFDNALVTATVTHDTNGTMATFDPPGLLDVLTQHTLSLVYTDSASNVSSNNFTNSPWRTLAIFNCHRRSL